MPRLMVMSASSINSEESPSEDASLMAETMPTGPDKLLTAIRPVIRSVRLSTTMRPSESVQFPASFKTLPTVFFSPSTLKSMTSWLTPFSS